VYTAVVVTCLAADLIDNDRTEVSSMTEQLLLMPLSQLYHVDETAWLEEMSRLAANHCFGEMDVDTWRSS